MINFKYKIYNLIRDDDDNDIYSNIFDGIIIGLILINVILVIADTFNLPYWLKSVSSIIEIVSVIIFTLEYLLRLWTADLLHTDLSPIKSRLKYILSFMAADNCGADWNEQAMKSAESYLKIMAFSRDGLIEQLEYDGFTNAQAVYAAKANGY